MRKIYIKEKLEEIEFPVETLSLGDFDYIGEFTAKKTRSQDKDLYSSVGCFFRPNYERGLLIYSMISKFRIDSFLEIGFGRGYATFCAAKAMCDAGIDGKITTVDPNFDENFLKQLQNIFPPAWFSKIEFVQGPSSQIIPGLEGDYDMIYIDGDHRYDAVKNDWLMCKDKYRKFLLFDDYHMPTKKQKDIECSRVIDQIDDDTKELIIMDRRIFFDDRRISDEDIDYGQVLLRNKDFDTKDYILDW